MMYWCKRRRAYCCTMRDEKESKVIDGENLEEHFFHWHNYCNQPEKKRKKRKKEKKRKNRPIKLRLCVLPTQVPKKPKSASLINPSAQVQTQICNLRIG